jgi:ERCC4-type nuclease
MSKTQQKLVEKEGVSPGQIYLVERNEDYYQVLYADEQVVLLRSDDPGRNGGNVHRIERRGDFEQQVKSGWFVYQPDSDLDMISFSEVEWSQVSQIGVKTEENLHAAGFKTNLDIQQADDSELLDISGVGPTGKDNLRKFAR